jgi:hypothetical protein
MPNNKDLSDPHQLQATSHDEPPHGPDLVTRRVLLHELLIEEYETHTPFVETPAPTPETAQLARTLPDLRNVRQPALERKDVDELRPAGESDQEKEAQSARRVAAFFTLVTKAQKKEADERFRVEDLPGDYLRKLDQAWDKAEVEWKRSGKRHEDFVKLRREQLVELAIAHEIYGILEDYRERARRERLSADGGRPSAQQIESSALASWINDLHKEGAEPEPAATGQPSAPTQTPKQVGDQKAGDAKAGDKAKDDGATLEDL